MRLRVPYYYKDFKCIAGACKDSCCVGWEIDIDGDTFAYYQELEGDFGDRLRSSMAKGEENTFVLENGRCPFLNRQNLCDICLELGEEALCQVCTEYPRFVTEYGDVTEKSLALSCEVVGKLVFGRKEPIYYEEFFQQDCFEETDMEEEEYERAQEAQNVFGKEDEEAGESKFVSWIEKARDLAIRLIQDRRDPIEERICRMLEFACDFQNTLVKEDVKGMNQALHMWESQKTTEKKESSRGGKNAREDTKAKERETAGNDEAFALQAFLQRIRFFEGMEVLDEEWERIREQTEETIINAGGEGYAALHRSFMDSLRSQEREYEYEHLCVYFLFRYAMQTVYDSNFWGHAAATAACFLMIRDMDMVRFFCQEGKFSLEDRIDVARIFSKEAEHSEENMEYILDGVYYEEFMTIDNLLRQITGIRKA